MPKKKFELDTNIEQALNKYLENSQLDFDQVVNQALKEYLLKQLGCKDCRKLFNKPGKDADLSKYADEFLRNSINDNY